MQHPRLGLKSLIPRRRQFRKEPTTAEIILWKSLRAKKMRGVKFRRQHGIGPYIVDFCAPHLKVIVEVDGDIHFLPEEIKKDQVRQKELEALGYCVIRFTNEEVFKNLEGVLQYLWSHPLLTKERVGERSDSEFD